MIGWELPETVKIGGCDYAICADYRDVLGVIAQLQNEEETEQTRLYVALALFYEEFDAMPRECRPEAAAYLMRFIACGEEQGNERHTPRRIDWEQDLRLIVSDINRVAGCEVRALPFLHWWTFIAWFNGIGEGQLSVVVGIREKLRKGKKLEKWEKSFYAENKAQVDLQKKYTAEEVAEQERLKKLLGE